MMITVDVYSPRVQASTTDADDIATIGWVAYIKTYLNVNNTSTKSINFNI